MNILEEFVIQEDKYACIQKVSIESKIIYVCKNLTTNELVYFKDNSQEELDQIEDKKIKEKIEKLIYAKSEDVV